MRNAAQRELVCSSWGCVCLCVCASLWTGWDVCVSGLPKLLHVKDAPEIDKRRTAEPLFWRKIFLVLADTEHGERESCYYNSRCIVAPCAPDESKYSELQLLLGDGINPGQKSLKGPSMLV